MTVISLDSIDKIQCTLICTAKWAGTRNFFSKIWMRSLSMRQRTIPQRHLTTNNVSTTKIRHFCSKKNVDFLLFLKKYSSPLLSRKCSLLFYRNENCSVLLLILQNCSLLL